MGLLQICTHSANPKWWHGFEFRKTKHYEDNILMLIFDPEMKRGLKGETIKEGVQQDRTTLKRDRGEQERNT